LVVAWQECLALGEEGYTELQSVYDDAVKAGLSGEDVDDAAKLLELIKNAQVRLDLTWLELTWSELI
jgi:hypothetical protein